MNYLRPFYFVAFQAACAHIGGFRLAVLEDGDLLHVGFKGPLGLAVAVADVIAGVLPLIADAANSRHDPTSSARFFVCGR